MSYAKFGPAGNSQSFFDAGYKATKQVFPWLREKGLNAYEYQAGKGLFASENTLKEIGTAAKENGIAISLHAPYYISLSSVEEETRLRSVNYILQSASASDILGASVFVVHSGSAAKLDREEAMRKAEDTLEKTAVAMEENGLKAHVGLETMGKINQLGTLEEVLRLCKVSPKHFRPVVDFGHLNARTLGGLATTDDFKRIFEKISSSLGAEYAETLHCHFSKIEYTKMGEKKHLTFEDQVYGPSYEKLLDAVVVLGVTPTIVCESDGTMTEDALTMMRYYDESRQSR